MAKPVNEQKVQEMIDASLTEVYQGINPALTGIYYSRRETVENEWGVSVLEEINSEDYKVQCARSGFGSFFWMDDNPANANMTFEAVETGGYSKIHLNNRFMLINQSDGIYCFPNLKVFETNEDAKTYFLSKNWRKINTLYRTADGDLKATY